jgi:3'-phosphoadenosine 5'-phosphosulfate sulfotransferase (PAPS reductase)/FAD synthetase
MDAIKKAVESGAHVVFPNALIAGDVVMTHLISRLGLFEKIPVLFVNTLHLFDETLDFIDEIEKEYKFKGHISMAEGITGDRYEAKAQYDKKYGADLWKLDIE